MPFPGYHASRIADPDLFSKKRYAKGEFGDGIDVIYGITSEGKAEIQAIRFSKDKFTPEQAKAWLKKHPEFKPILFEPAIPVKPQVQKVSDPYDQFQRTLWDLQHDTAGYAQVHYCPTCRLNKVEGHDAILQGLDRKVGKLYFGKEPFLSTVNDWNGIPLIYGKIHPDPLKFDADPEAELARIQGGITGELSDAALETIGRARLMVKKNYTEDTALRMYDAGKISVDTLNRSFDAIPESLKLIESGRLSHSSAFICPDDGESLYGVVKPNHVLDFEETSIDQPVDKMAVVLNKQETENVTEGNAQLQIGKVISAKNAGKLQAAFDALKQFVTDILSGDDPEAPAEPQMNKTEGEMNTPGGEPLTEKPIDARQAKENKMTPEEEKLMAEKDAEIAALKAKITELEGATSQTQKDLDAMKVTLKEFETAKVQAQKAAFDAAWDDLEKSTIPPGEIKDPADKVKLQKEAIDAPLVFAKRVAGWKSAPKKGEEGSAHTQGPGAGNHNAELSRILAANTPAIPGRLH